MLLLEKKFGTWLIVRGTLVHREGRLLTPRDTVLASFVDDPREYLVFLWVFSIFFSCCLVRLKKHLLQVLHYIWSQSWKKRLQKLLDLRTDFWSIHNLGIILQSSNCHLLFNVFKASSPYHTNDSNLHTSCKHPLAPWSVLITGSNRIINVNSCFFPPSPLPPRSNGKIKANPPPCVCPLCPIWRRPAFCSPRRGDNLPRVEKRRAISMAFLRAQLCKTGRGRRRGGGGGREEKWGTSAASCIIKRAGLSAVS